MSSEEKIIRYHTFYLPYDNTIYTIDFSKLGSIKHFLKTNHKGQMFPFQIPREVFGKLLRISNEEKCLIRDILVLLLCPPIKKNEKWVQKFLISNIFKSAQEEVVTEVGRIDLLTEDFLIEIKKYSDWKHGIGQLNAYSIFYPTRKKVLILFSDSPKSKQVLPKMDDIEVFHFNTLDLELTQLF